MTKRQKLQTIRSKILAKEVTDAELNWLFSYIKELESSVRVVGTMLNALGEPECQISK
jgi:hypothetical protein